MTLALSDWTKSGAEERMPILVAALLRQLKL
jgi:hypothetical protein